MRGSLEDCESLFGDMVFCNEYKVKGQGNVVVLIMKQLYKIGLSKVHVPAKRERE